LVSWNVVSILVLLCQGFLFETSDADSAQVILTFGVLIVIILSMCILMTVLVTIYGMLYPYRLKEIIVPQAVFQRLPLDMQFEIHFINTLNGILDKGEMLVKVQEWRNFMTKAEFSTLLEFVKTIRNEDQTIGEFKTEDNILHLTMPTRTNPLDEENMLVSQQLMIEQFKEYNLQAAGMSSEKKLEL
jgi:hypothetical protein